MNWTEFTEWLQSKNEFYRLKEAIIDIDFIKDTTFRTIDTIWQRSISSKHNAAIVTSRDSLGRPIGFIREYGAIKDLPMPDLALEKCVMPYGLRFHNSSFKNFKIESGTANEIIIFFNCNFKENVRVHDFIGAGIVFMDCTFEENSAVIIRNSDIEKFILKDVQLDCLSISKSKLGLCRISDSQGQATLLKIDLVSDTINRLSITGSPLGGLDLKRSIIDVQLLVKDSPVKNHFAMEGARIPEPDKTEFIWRDLQGFTLAIPQRDTLDEDIFFVPSSLKRNGYYKADKTNELNDTYSFNQLIGLYRKLHAIFQARGDRNSLNGCFTEMKDLETRRARYLWEQDRSLGAWFDWRLNQFLKYFCDYGTSPVKALIRSMWTILLFALLYFFFYSDWDKINRGFLIRQHRRLLRYFRSEIRLEELYHEDYQEEYRSYEDYRRELEESRVEVPYYIHLLGRPLYHLSLLRHRAMGAVYRRLEVLGGVWKELPPRRQWVTGVLVGLAVGGYLVHLALVRTLNSVMLSINTFSTLGFGDIPVRGWIRYAAILEGFLGWFLLSIFSVSLISQILQV